LTLAPQRNTIDQSPVTICHALEGCQVPNGRPRFASISGLSMSLQHEPWFGSPADCRPTLLRFGLLAGWFFAATVTSSPAQPPPGGPPAPVKVAVVEKREVITGRTFVGTVVPFRVSTVGGAVEGRVEKLLVRRGDFVAEGQQLARLRTRTLEIELAGAEAELRLREHELAELEKTAPREIEQAKRRLLASEALKEFTSDRADRTKQLYDDKAVSEDELDDRLSAAEVAEQTYRENEAAYDLATSGKWDDQIDQAKARVEIQRQVIERLRDDIDQHTITAPFDGFVTEKHTEIGQWLAKGGPVIEIIDCASVDVEVPVLESYVSQLREDKTPARIEVPALSGKSFQGTVVAVVPHADDRSRSFPVKVRIRPDPKEPDGVMPRPGMFARVTLPVGNRESALLVPKDALVLDRDATLVWAVTPDRKSKLSGQGTVRPVPVELGVADGEMIEVRGPLRERELVIVEGNERVNPAAPVRMTNYPLPANEP
jgi:RND family efflux transporter MFP subunit